jgi:hypothetical protein
VIWQAKRGCQNSLPNALPAHTQRPQPSLGGTRNAGHVSRGNFHVC